ncbi:response regulator [Desulfopila sp. IMCC35006]|nr:response regulator [Desulfopila sp. IMCC35006]
MMLARAVGSGMDELISSGIPSYAVTLLITCGVGKISDLTKSLKHEIKEHKRIGLELQQYKETLEKNIKERTKDLMRSNEQLKQEMLKNEQANKENLNLQTSLKQAEKMEAVGQLAGGVAHDFNNMLGVILGHTEMGMEQIDTSHPLFADLKEIQKAAIRSADITRQLLAFARKQTVAPKSLDLNQAIERMLKMLQRLIGEGINLVWLPGPGLWPVKIDPSQIDQIMANLCINARDAIAGVGKMTVETGNDTLDEEYCRTHPGFIAGEFVRISVRDNGCGMNEETLAHIFEPFFTTKDLGKGTGLGLATVYGAVKQNKGFINAESEKGQGTTFTIYLPRHVDSAGDAPPGKGAESGVGGHETILLVEDEKTILQMTKTMLQLLGYTVIAAATPREALHLADAFASEIHLLLTDIVMPEMNGRDLAKKLSSLHPQLKCLYMSGYTSDIIAQQGILDKGIQFIQKPFSKNDLATKVRIVLQ